MATKKKKNYTYSVGKRKGAVARIRLFKGGEQIMVNGKPIGKYFAGPVSESLWKKPFRLTDTLDKYYVTAKIEGGGIFGQLEAFSHGVSKAFVKIDNEKFRPVLKKAGLLTRDSRIRERRKVGTGGRARRKKQSPKR